MKKVIVLAIFAVLSVTCAYSQIMYGGGYSERVYVRHTQSYVPQQQQPVIIIYNNNNNTNTNNNNNSNERYGNKHNYQKSQQCEQPRPQQYEEEIFDEQQQTPCQQVNQDMWVQTIWFECGVSDLRRTDNLVTLENIIRFISENPTTNIEVRGFASKRKGSWTRNYNLAKNRANNVCDYLESKCGIPSTQIRKFVVGTDDSEYDTDSWNQCVTIKFIQK